MSASLVPTFRDSAPATPAAESARPPLRSRRLASFLGGSVTIIAVVVLVGWSLDDPRLTGFYGSITMKTNAAIGLLLCGVAVWSFGRVPWLLTSACGALAATIGALTLVEHLSGLDLGIDQALFTEPMGAAATASPNRMGPNGSTGLVLAGVALMLLVRGTATSIRYAQTLVLIGLVLALVAVAGYLYGAAQLYAVAQYTGIALHTALALITLHVGVLALRTDAGPMTHFASDGPEGTLLRRLAMPLTLLPLGIGYLVLTGSQVELYDRGLGYAIFATALVMVLWATVWQTARSIAAADGERRAAERHRDELLVRERGARDEAERANRLKDQFIATMSHELRTPLNVMLGWTQVLEGGGSADTQARAAAIVARNGRLLARLVEDLLDISRAAAGQFDIVRETMSLNNAAQAAFDAMAPVAAANGVTLVSSFEAAPDTIDADAARLQQVVWNLLSNAVKFTSAGGRVEVSTEARDRHVVLTVTDTGRGFDAAFAPHIFEPFRQADASTRREHGGLGLGLSIARHLVELHGGTIRAESAGVGRGATFVVTLPARSAELDRSNAVIRHPAVTSQMDDDRAESTSKLA
jgi:signal transduction histidine kinase